MTIQQILALDEGDLMKLDTPTLKRYTTQLSSAANKRVKRLENSGINSPALQGTRRSGGHFGVKRALKATDNEAQQRARVMIEFRRVKAFLEAATSTVTGAREWEERVKEDLGVEDMEVLELVTDIYAMIMNERPDLVHNLPPSEVYSIISVQVEDAVTELGTVDTVKVYLRVIQRLEELAEENG